LKASELKIMSAQTESTASKTPISRINEHRSAESSRAGGVARLAVALAVAAGLVLVTWYAGRVLLLGFAGFLVALLLQTCSAWVSSKTRLPYRMALSLVLIALAAMIGLFLWTMGTTVAGQVQQLSESLPTSLSELKQQLRQSDWGRWMVAEFDRWKIPAGGGAALRQLTGAASATFGFVLDLIVILFVGVCGAAEPRVYRTGLIKLFPQEKRNRVDEVIGVTTHTLRRWMLGQLCSMTIVGVVIGLGLSLIGVPAAIALGLIAATMEIIPNFGPAIAAVPALLLAMSQGTSTLLYVVLLYSGVQLLESYLVWPLINRQSVQLPPALTILVIILLGMIGGIVGVFVATPLAAATMVIVKMIYVQDTLGDEDVELNGE
jgi:predicted PurR-regulated permease PerM